MAQKTVRYDARFDAKVMLEALVTEEWQAIDGRGFESQTSHGSKIQVFPEASKVVVFDQPGVSLEQLELAIRTTLQGVAAPDLNLGEFIDPADCECPLSHIRKLCEQINECYSIKAYDAVAVLMRRVVESLLIECFEKKNLAALIKYPNDAYFMLADLIDAAEQQNQANMWRLTNKCRVALPLLKEVGDLSAHGRYYTTKKRDVDDLRLRFSVTLANLKSIAELD